MTVEFNTSINQQNYLVRPYSRLQRLEGHLINTTMPHPTNNTHYDRLNKILGHLPPSGAFTSKFITTHPVIATVSRIKLGQVVDGPSKQVIAATTIQRVYRGHCGRIIAARQKAQILSWQHFAAGRTILHNSKALDKCPRARNGKTPVFLPKQLPIVLKHSGNKESLERFKTMQQARAICERNGYSHLVIPKARVHGDFIIESKLPLQQGSYKEEIGLYIENRDRFTEAVKEFTGFLCQSIFHDIVGGSNHPYPQLTNMPAGRYDNVALYVDSDNQGKFGLIDLERFRPRCDRTEKKWCFLRCLDAVSLFPYHLDEIISVAQKFDPNIHHYRESLEERRDRMLDFFKVIYEDHAVFIKTKGISAQHPTAFEKLSKERIGQLQKALEQELRSQHIGWEFGGLLGDNPDQTVKNFNANFLPKILSATYQLINDSFGYQRGRLNIQGPITSNQQLLAFRSLKFGNHFLEWQKFCQNTKKFVKLFKIENAWDIPRFQSLLFDTILKEFERGQEVASYFPNIGYDFNKLILL